MSEEINKAYFLANIVEKAKEDSERNFFTIGAALATIADEKLYKDYASHTNSMEEFLKEFGFSRSFAFNAMRVHRTFGHLDCNGVLPDRLVRMLPLRLKEEEKKEWLDIARELPASGFNDSLREAKGKTPTDKCEHSKTILIEQCEECGRRVKNERK